MRVGLLDIAVQEVYRHSILQSQRQVDCDSCLACAALSTSNRDDHGLPAVSAGMAVVVIVVAVAA